MQTFAPLWHNAFEFLVNWVYPYQMQSKYFNLHFHGVHIEGSTFPRKNAKLLTDIGHAYAQVTHVCGPHIVVYRSLQHLSREMIKLVVDAIKITKVKRRKIFWLWPFTHFCNNQYFILVSRFSRLGIKGKNASQHNPLNKETPSTYDNLPNLYFV